MKRTATSTARGFSTLQLVITIAIMGIVTTFAVVSITRARDHVRLMGSARQFAAYAERSRADAVRRHNTATLAVIDNNTYSITMDWDGFGTTRTQNFDLDRGVTFTTGNKSVTFDWRGRIASEESFGFVVNRNSSWEQTVSVGITGSGDVTFEAQYFYDASLPPGTVNGTGGAVIPEPGASPVVPPAPSPTPTPTPNASPTPTPDPNASPTPTPTPYPYATPTPTPTPTSYPTPTPTPTATATPVLPCTIEANPASLSIVENGSATVSVNRTNITGTGTITATSSNGGQIQVAPASKVLSGTSAVTFTVTVKKNNGSVTFAATGCTSKTVDVTIQ